MDMSAAEIRRRIAKVRACKERAWKKGFKAPTSAELTEALGDDVGISQETVRRESRRRRRYDRGGN